MSQQQYNVKFPRQVFSGKGSMEQLKNIVKATAATSVCLMTDKGVSECGLAKLPLAVLENCDVKITVLDDVAREPSVYDVKSTYDRLKECGVDLIVAIGGGSVIDMSKIMSVAMTNDRLIEDLRAEGVIVNPSLPMVAIPTTSGTGAEATANAIFLYPEEDLKVGIVHENMVPDYVILDASVTSGLPPALTASTGVDALCHAVESYISTIANPVSRMFSLKATELICRSIEKAYENGNDFEAREEMQLGSFYAGICLTSSSTVAVHALSYPLGGKYHIPHGVSNAILLPYVMEANMECCKEEFTTLAPYMIPDIQNVPKEHWPQKVVDYLYSLMKKLDIPDTLTGFGVKPEDLDYLTDNAVKVERLLLKNPKKLSKEEIKQIYKKLL